MRNIATLLMLSTSLVSTAMAENISLFGIALGSPIPSNIPECAKNKYGYEPITKFLCIEANLKTPFKRVNFPAEQSPVYVKNLNVLLYTSDDLVEKIEFFTRGPDSNSIVMDALTNKFGKPSSSTNSLVQNAMGASFPKVLATWSKGEAIVEYASVWTKVDTGHVSITTKKWREIEQRNSNVDKTNRIEM